MHHNTSCRFSLIQSVLLFLITCIVAQSNAFALDLKLSFGSSFQQSNDVQIPNDNTGTRFSLNDIAGEGPWSGARIEALWNINDKHAVRVLLAPLSYSEQGVIDSPINFAGASFSESQPVIGEYTFNSWRVGYRYHLQARKRWNSWIGATLKVRDAEITLIQGAVSGLDDDLGIVPLLYLAGEYRFDGPWTISADVDALGGGPGRAIDLGVNLSYIVHEKLKVGLEYRLLEGGADIDQLFNFALFNSGFFTVRYTP